MNQLTSIATASSGFGNSTSVICSFGFGSNQPDPSHYQGECTSDGTSSIQLPSLGTGEQREFLLRCASCPVNSDGTVPSRLIQVEYSDATVNPTSDVLDRIDADIRPFNQWVGAFSARDNDQGTADDNETNMPKQNLMRIKGWGYTDQATVDNYALADNIRNKYVTVLVHGFSVSRSDDLNQFIPTYTKRLYWVGHPVLPNQKAKMADGTEKHAYTCGIAWKGDHRDYLTELNFIQNLKQYLPDSWNDWITGKVESAQNGLNGLYFPSDEFKALQSGVPVAALFTKLQNNNNQTIVIAHSLGNMVVNSALTQSAPSVISKYIMNEGAVPAQAFAKDFNHLTEPDGTTNTFDASLAKTNDYIVPFLQPYRKLLFDAHMEQMGEKLDDTDNVIDAPWRDLWGSVKPDVVDRLNRCVTPPCTPTQIYNSFYTEYGSLFGSLISDEGQQAMEDDYTIRWASHRPDGTVPPIPSTVPWQGFFAGNLAKTDIYNSFDYGDCVLAHPWYGR